MISFSGRNWYVKSGSAMGPGPNNWSPNNVWVDEDGKLHLKISFNTITQKWDCAEVWTEEKLGFGTYEWILEGAIDALPENVVLGLFNYMEPNGKGSEIDIEYSKWGIPTLAKTGSFTVWPPKAGLKRWTSSFAILPIHTQYPTSHKFSWQSRSIEFRVTGANSLLIGSATYRPKRYNDYIPQIPEHLNINLWLNQGLPGSLTMDQTVEVVIISFKKT